MGSLCSVPIKAYRGQLRKDKQNTILEENIWQVPEN
jgi:hypothetical protein